jgi:Lar family restriction alleviation protein
MSTPDLPCPFCGGTELKLAIHHMENTSWFITCWNCETEGPVIQAQTKEEAEIKAREVWNKRVLGRSEYTPG